VTLWEGKANPSSYARTYIAHHACTYTVFGDKRNDDALQGSVPAKLELEKKVAEDQGDQMGVCKNRPKCSPTHF
jgi:hypothetical protein